MKPEELRIGNWVRHYSSWSYRQPNQGPMEEFDFQWDDRDWYAMGECTMEIDEIKPIPITEEWLLKFGFEKEHGAYKNGHDLWIALDWLGEKLSEPAIWIRGNHYPSIKIGYVHQLQNLYYALTGKELMIK